jgi:Mrp family chromosome partitioning ATPase
MTTTPTARPGLSTPARPGGGPGLPAGGGASGLTTIDPIKLLRKHMGLLMLTFALSGVLGAGVFLALRFTMPRYACNVIFRCLQVDDTASIGTAPTIDRDELDRFMGTQVAQLMSDQFFDRVKVDNRLPTEAAAWYQAFAVNRKGEFDPVESRDALKDSVTARVIPNTFLIQLRVTAPTKEAAVGLARVCRDVYEKSLQSAVNADVSNRRDSLRGSLSTLTTEYEDLKAQRDRLMRDQNIDSVDATRSESRVRLDEVGRKLLEIRQAIQGSSVQLDTYERMLAEGGTIQYNDTQRDGVEQHPLILQQRQTLKQLETELLALKLRQIGTEHYAFKRLESLIEATNGKIDSVREELLRQRFDADVDALRRGMGQLRAQEADLLTEQGDLNTKVVALSRFIEQVNDYERQMTAKLEQVANATEQLNEIEQRSKLSDIARIRVEQSERTPDRLAFPRPEIIIPATILLLTGLVAGLVTVRELFDQRVKSPSDAASGRGRLLGTLPSIDEDPAAPKSFDQVFRESPSSVSAEHVRQVRTVVLKAMAKAQHRSLVVVGAMPGSGSTGVALNLALACSATDRRVLLIDANFRRPGVHARLGLNESNGLADALSALSSPGLGAGAAGKAIEAAVQPLGAGLPDVMTAGSTGKRVYERLGGTAMAALLAEAGERYDLIFIDTAPAVVAGDAQAICGRADASLLVVRAFQEKRGLVARLRNELGDARAEFLGVVLNAVKASAGGYMRENLKRTHEYQASGKGAKADGGTSGETGAAA